MTQDRQIHEAVVRQLVTDGLGINSDVAIPNGQRVNIEFYVNYRNNKVRIRAKTVVVYSMLKSAGTGAELDLAITMLSREDRHTLGNILQLFENAKNANNSP